MHVEHVDWSATRWAGLSTFNPLHDEQQSKSNQLIMNSEYSSRSGQGKQKKRPEISFCPVRVKPSARFFLPPVAAYSALPWPLSSLASINIEEIICMREKNGTPIDGGVLLRQISLKVTSQNKLKYSVRCVNILIY
jgi:hypothetical protein